MAAAGCCTDRVCIDAEWPVAFADGGAVSLEACNSRRDVYSYTVAGDNMQQQKLGQTLGASHIDSGFS